MPPQESSRLLLRVDDNDDKDSLPDTSPTMFSTSKNKRLKLVVLAVLGVILVLIAVGCLQARPHAGSYKLVEFQTGTHLLDFYDFYDGEDSLGSAGFNSYVSRDKSEELGLFYTTENALFMQSAPNGNKKRHSIRLEGKRRFERGLFVLHVDHIPAGCGTWPAFWLTDEDNWPNNGEIDIVEGVNDQRVAKTALHTSSMCSMYGNVSPYQHTGVWDRATGIPNTWTGEPDTQTSVPADNCWTMAPHQWGNQGCVLSSTENNTLGQPFNEQGGGVYVLEWDPDAGYIKSWAFPQSQGYPDNLQTILDSPDGDTPPEPDAWERLPYAYFAIGKNTGCSADHFTNMRLIFNLAFCGTVAGNRFARDCPALAKRYEVPNDVVATCNNYIASDPEASAEAYWKVRGVYVYERDQAWF